MIAIIDSGGANISSVQFALERLGAKSVLTRDVAEIVAADRVILPGVGAAPVAINVLRNAQLIEPIRKLRQPVHEPFVQGEFAQRAAAKGETKDATRIFLAMSNSLP